MLSRTFKWSIAARLVGSLLLFATSGQALAQIAPNPVVGLNFYPPYVTSGGTTTLNVSLHDDNYQLVNAGFVTGALWDFSTSGFQYTGAPVSNGCGGTVIVAATSLSVLGVNWLYSYPPCTISFEVKYVGSAQSPSITFPAGLFFNGGVANLLPSTATLCVVAPTVVTNTNDSGVGSLRDAINTINNGCAAPYDITFAITPSAPAYTIRPLTQLPAITPPSSDYVTITAGTAGTPDVFLDGSACGGGCNGLVIAGNVQVTGIAVGSFKLAGVEVQSGYGSFYQVYLGTDVSGTQRHGNGIGMDVAAGANGSFNGGIAIANGVGFRSAGSFSAYSSKIGVDAAGAVAGNGTGLLATAGRASVRNSEVRGNKGAGMALTGPTTFGDLTSNVAYGNGGPAVDLGNDGVTPNDEQDPGPYDTDTGPNNLLNYPTFTSTYDGVSTVVTGTLKTKSGQYQVDLFENSVPRTTATGGETYLNSQYVTTDANGVATFTFTLVGLHDNLSMMSAVCSEGCSFNSEYSPSVRTLLPGPGVSLSPSSLDFGVRSLGTASPVQTVVLLNSGTGDLGIRNLYVAGDFRLSSTCPIIAPLAPGAACTIDVTFVPFTEGTRLGAITLETSDAGSPRTVTLSGIGVILQLPTVSTDSSSIDFGTLTVGASSPPHVVHVSNTGAARLTFEWHTEGPFTLVPVPQDAGNACGPTLDVAQTCVIAVAFTPVIVGGVPGALVISSDASNPTVTIELAGHGVSGPPPRALSLPDLLDFGGQPFGLRSSGRPVTVTNNSLQPVHISDVAAGGDFTLDDACVTLAPAAACTITVYFKPSARGVRSGTLVLTVLGDTQPYSVALSGIGEANAVPLLDVSPVRFGFGNTVIGPAGPPTTFHLSNIGEVPVSLPAIAPPGEFLIASHCPSSLDAGASCTLDVRFYPRLIGLRSARVGIPSNAGNGPHTIELSGVGCSLLNVARARIPQLVCGP